MKEHTAAAAIAPFAFGQAERSLCLAAFKAKEESERKPLALATKSRQERLEFMTASSGDSLKGNFNARSPTLSGSAWHGRKSLYVSFGTRSPLLASVGFGSTTPNY
jgi:hypothetical protein